MGIFEKIRKKRFFMFFMLLACLLPLVLPQAVQAASTDLTLTVDQVFTKPEGSQAADTFTYSLTALQSGSPMPGGSSGDTWDFTISGTDTISIEPITYSTPGSYSYELRQTVLAEQTGYTYDMQVYTINVNVTYVGGELQTNVVVEKDNGYKVSVIEFNNSYQPLASNLMVDPPVKKTVTGTPSADGTFTFKLEAENKSNPMPSDSEDGVKLMTIVGEGEDDFGTWSYSEEGTYHYTVKEVNNGEDGYTYDTTVYTITDIVTDVDGQLVVARTITNDSNETMDSYDFVNIYTSGDKSGGGSTTSGTTGTTGSTNGVKTGDSSRISYYQVMFLISGILLVYVVFLKKSSKKGLENVN
ncbi:MAG: Spy0128 family protein [Lachnospiraceae bacterium]